jgi:hypothetical protein
MAGCALVCGGRARSPAPRSGRRGRFTAARRADRADRRQRQHGQTVRGSHSPRRRDKHRRRGPDALVAGSPRLGPVTPAAQCGQPACHAQGYLLRRSQPSRPSNRRRSSCVISFCDRGFRWRSAVGLRPVLSLSEDRRWRGQALVYPLRCMPWRTWRRGGASMI